MLKQLFIQNYAIIEMLRIDFTKHLNIITGETGAGKSILMGALSLILGDRADTGVLLNKEEKCIVEGKFLSSERPVKDFLVENELDEENEILIRREISATGKSRAFVNDTPVTLQQLKALSGLLVDLHRQFDTQHLNDAGFQLNVIDALAGHHEKISEYKTIFKQYKSLQLTLRTLQDEQAASEKESGYHKFLFEELEKANFSENEIEELEQEIRIMSNAENIKSTLTSVLYSMNEHDESLLAQLKTVKSSVGSLKNVHPSLSDIDQRLESVLIELKDLFNEVESVNDDVSYSEEKMHEMNERMSTAYSLLKKHQVHTTADLLKVKQQLEAKLQRSGDRSAEIAQMEKQLAALEKNLTQQALKIRKNRQNIIPDFEKKVNSLLQQVGMPNARLKVEMKENEWLLPSGMDNIDFLFNANKTGFQPVSKVASGGELSRLMLIIKSLVAKSMSMPTLIFDEIDSGISGEAAKQVGLIIKDLSEDHQILLITHQPQIAAKAFSHFFVYKEVKSGKVITAVKQLNSDERIHAIATMLSGDKPTAAAVENAREMID